MIRPAILCSLLAMAVIVTTSGEEFPLTFQTIPAKDVMSFPGGSGTYGQLGLSKPGRLLKEPKAMSRHPLYGVCRGTPSGPAFLFRLDESKGNGKGYDQLIVDMNQNGDLTDDPASQRVSLPTDRRASLPDQMLFGPIQAPADKTLAGGRPVYYARIYIFNRQLLSSGRTDQAFTVGQLMLKAGWYLDATVALDGLKQTVGVYDSHRNLRLGDVARSQTFTNRAEISWYFRAGDTLLVDADGSGGFENDVFQSKAYPFGPILYLAASGTRLRWPRIANP